MARTAVRHAATASSATPPIDLTHLAAQTFGNRALEQEVLSLFLKQSASLMQRLENAAHDAQIATIHTIKGSARSIGAGQVAFVAEGIEAELNAGNSPSFVALAAAVDHANAYIRKLISR